MNRPIGIFDSGVGGLTVLRELMKRLPNEDLIYFGDTARVPYGIKSPETVTRYSLEIADFLMERGIKILVVACNTASSIAIPELTAHVSVPVIGVLVSGARAAVRYSQNGKIGVVGTESTIASSAYRKAIHRIDSKMEVHTRACPLFVSLAEEGWADHPITGLVVREYLGELQTTGIDTLVLGCTHYPLLKPAIQEVVGEGVRLIDSAEETALEVGALLESDHSLRGDNPRAQRTYFVTDSPPRFRKVGEHFLQQALPEIDQVTI